MSSVSYQLYSSRNFGPLSKTLKMLAGAGYENVEGFGGVFDDPEGLASDLANNGLKMPTTHLGLDQVENKPEWVVEIARTVGFETVYVPHLAEEYRPATGAGWADFGRRLYAAGAPLRDAGIGFGWHNHAFEFVACADGTMPIEAMLDAAPGLDLELDIAWVARAGQSATEWIKKLKDRMSAAHIKDIAPAGECEDEDGWADVGHGVMDWAAINGALVGAALKWSVMEHDNPSDDIRFATRSIATVNSW